MPNKSPHSRKRKRHLASEIAIAIRDGEYRSGEWLRQIDLEEKFRAKRFEIRAALAELKLRQSVDHVPNRGYRVNVPNIDEMRELLSIRALLEVEAANSALPNLDKRAMNEILACADRFEHAIRSNASAEQSRADISFHDAIYKHAGNKKLIELIAEIRNRAGPWPITIWPSGEAMNRSAADHRTIIKALRSGDHKALSRIIRHHIVKSEPHYSHYTKFKSGHLATDRNSRNCEAAGKAP